MRLGEQRQVDGVEGEVAAEREQTQPGVTVDVALADLDEPATVGQQFSPARWAAPVSELSTMSTPYPSVSRRISSAKSVLRES